MGSRYSVAEALRRGWVTPAQAKAMRAAPRGQYTERMPQEVLFDALCERLGRSRVHGEFKGAVAGRKFRIDCALPDFRIGVECDGFRYHRSLTAFKKDRRRQNLLVMHGWRVLRYFPEEIFGDIHGVVDQVAEAVRQVEPATDSGQVSPLAGNVPHGTKAYVSVS